MDYTKLPSHTTQTRASGWPSDETSITSKITQRASAAKVGEADVRVWTDMAYTEDWREHAVAFISLVMVNPHKGIQYNEAPMDFSFIR